MLDRMTVKHMTQSLVVDFYRQQMSRATDHHLSAILSECFDPKKNGTEVTDLMVNNMLRYTDLTGMEITATLQYVAIDEAAQRYLKSLSGDNTGK